MIKKISTLLAVAVGICSITTAATEEIPLLPNDTVSMANGWLMGGNQFDPVTVWRAYALFDDFGDNLQPSGGGYNFLSWDDGTSSKIEFFLYNEWTAGPPGAFANQTFETGDIIRFKGTASATTSAQNVIARVFIKTLGYVNNQAFSILNDYTQFQNLTTSAEAFDLSVTFPDLAVDDSLQVLQVGFELTTIFNGSVMESGTISFENLEATIEREAAAPTTWAGWDIGEMGVVDTGDWLGMVNVTHSPWIWLYTTESYVYIDPDTVAQDGGWAFFNQ